MLKNYIKIAWRNLWKHKLFSFINIFGLASGLVVCFLSIAHIKGSFDYDNFHPNRDRTYRILTDVVGQDNDVTPFATSPMPLAEVLKRDYPFVEEATRAAKTYGEFSSTHKRFTTVSYAVDPGFFRIFGYKLAKGRPATEPNTVVLTRKTAEKFFGTANPVGQVLQNTELGQFTVTGVLANMPVKSHLDFDMLFSLQTPWNPQQRASFADWRNYQTCHTYVLLKPGTAADALEKVLPGVVGRATNKLRFKTEKGYTLRVQPFTKLSPARQELMRATHEPQVGGLLVEAGVGLLTLLLAAFNYINLTLARSLSRAREVGIRKVAGAIRWQLVGQFMAESIILSLLALGLAYVMLEFIKPMAFVQQWLIGGVQWNWQLTAIFVLFSVVAGLLAGVVPARVLSGFQPSQVLRSQTGLRVIRGISLRKSLIVAQFSISLIAMIGLLSMSRQMNYMATADYGFRRDRVLTLPLNTVPAQRLANELNQLAGVEQVSATSELFGSFGESRTLKREHNGSDSSMAFLWSVDPQFVSTMNLTLLAGQNLPAASADSLASVSAAAHSPVTRSSTTQLALVNEEAVKAFRLGNFREAVGKSLWLNDSTEIQIAGVLKDFRFTSFAWAIKPLILRNQPDQFRYLTVSVTAGAEEAVLADTKQIWKRLSPYEPFAGQWYTDFLEQRHSHPEDMDFTTLLLVLSFSIACLGLLGMVTYTTQTRVKEVGVRKVLGAQVSQVVWLLSRDFVRLLLIAAAIAMPLGYLAGYAFLSNFAYHVSIGFETFALCFGSLLLLGSLTIGIRTYRAALENPVESLRSE
ncbi:FtsX-like permease family protein [Spirosoma sp. KCTC 42546]|uniref:ABC transporter permease n=1 Tax=Spirosoma sp. KCTC 42546 TaxID=2520506 RepID=UPI001159D57B|nr:ABC transporter permease [Spirosoma sp. KCTC 42546]QDK77926.1 FtsX-like permease family protein [Spirosoma sp. KCTC 42546]